LAPDAAAGLDALVLAEVDAAAAGVLLELLTLDVLLPHAASSRAVTPAAAAVINAVCFTISSTEPDCRRPGMTGAPEPHWPRFISLAFRRDEAYRTEAASLPNRDRKTSMAGHRGENQGTVC
jgi:hypothetical protein